jgi:hypothetical protein
MKPLHTFGVKGHDGNLEDMRIGTPGKWRKEIFSTGQAPLTSGKSPLQRADNKWQVIERLQ